MRYRNRLANSEYSIFKVSKLVRKQAIFKPGPFVHSLNKPNLVYPLISHSDILYIHFPRYKFDFSKEAYSKMYKYFPCQIYAHLARNTLKNLFYNMYRLAYNILQVMITYFSTEMRALSTNFINIPNITGCLFAVFFLYNLLFSSPIASTLYSNFTHNLQYMLCFF